MQAAYDNRPVQEWTEFTTEAMETTLSDPHCTHVKVRKMTAEQMAGKNKAIQKRREKNKTARKARKRT
jgi:hypothetical protein